MSDLRDNLEAKRCTSNQGTTVEEPLQVENPPGLSSIAYRIGTQPSFLARMRERLGTWALPDGKDAGMRPLADLDGGVDDPAVALLDTWAVTADVATFYQERIANEMFLRTAGEPLSVHELARLVGHEPSPGVAAGAFLAFSVETAPGAPPEALVPVGTQVASIPGQDQLPQTFETREAIVARAAWNALAPRIAEPQDDLNAAKELFLVGTETALEPGDLLLVVVRPEPEDMVKPESGKVIQAAVARLLTVETDDEVGHTRVTLQAGVRVFDVPPAPQPRPPSPTLGLDRATKADDVCVFALRQQLSFFGHNAARYGSLPVEEFVKDDPFTIQDPANNWDQGRTVWTDSRGVSRSAAGTDAASVFLSQRADDVIPGSWIVFIGTTLGEPRRQETRIFQVSGVSEASLADYALSGEASGLALTEVDRSPLATNVAKRVAFDVRRTTAYLVSEPLALAELPIPEPFPSAARDGDGGCLVLDRKVEGLGPGQTLALRGTLEGGGEESLIVALRAVDDDFVAGRTTLVFQQAVQGRSFKRDTILLNANVARATHGETVAEVLGSGDAGQVGQAFQLQRAPLTFESAPVPGGVASSLRVRVDGVQWREVESFHGLGPDAQAFTVEIDGEGRATVRFGDGADGARLSTGQENVTAVYRVGIGPDGEVAAGSLSLLTTRPLGISEVVNPRPAAGAAPADSVARIRRNAPVTARTLSRIVSLADFEDFALAFTGIGKVRAAPLGGVHLTVAGVGGAAVERGSVLFDNFLQAVESVRLPGPPLRLASYQPLRFDLAARLIVDPRFRAEDVFDEVRAKLLADYAFDRRELAMPLFTAEVIAAVQSIAGVVAVDLDAIHLVGTAPGVPARLNASPARLGTSPARQRGPAILPAQLLLINPDGITLGARTP